jgi:hypothetical protein
MPGQVRPVKVGSTAGAGAGKLHGEGKFTVTGLAVEEVESTARLTIPLLEDPVEVCDEKL